MMKRIWIYGWTYLFVALGLMDRAGDWLANQIDHNDYLAGAIGAICLMAIPYLVGAFDIVWK